MSTDASVNRSLSLSTLGPVHVNHVLLLHRRFRDNKASSHFVCETEQSLLALGMLGGS